MTRTRTEHRNVVVDDDGRYYEVLLNLRQVESATEYHWRDGWTYVTVIGREEVLVVAEPFLEFEAQLLWNLYGVEMEDEA